MSDTLNAVALLTQFGNDGAEVVSVHHKVTYRLGADGRCQRAERQAPLLLPVDADGGDTGFPESDVIPAKTRTDVIIMAEALAPSPGTTSMTVRLRVGNAAFEYAVIGQRRCIYHGRGTFRFSQPEPFERVPLSYVNAYGGVDEAVPVPDNMSLGAYFDLLGGEYPRNPIGKGYVVHESAARLDGLLLPLVEHPRMLVRPETLIVGKPEAWWKAPLPWACDWFEKDWFPRLGFAGAIPPGYPEPARDAADVRLGWLSGEDVSKIRARRLDTPVDWRQFDAASPSLAFPFLSGQETMVLEGVGPERGQPFVVRLPEGPPQMLVRHLGRVHELRPVPHRIFVSLVEMGLYVVWAGTWRPPSRLRPPDGAAADSPTGLEKVEVVSGGRVVPRWEECNLG